MTIEWSRCSESISRPLCSGDGDTSMTMPMLKTIVNAMPILGHVLTGCLHFHDMIVLKITVSTTPILGSVLSAWSHFRDHVCIENNSKCYTYTGLCAQWLFMLP